MQLKNLLKLCFFAVFCFALHPAMAQNKVITGKVTDAKDGSTLPGVAIVATGTQIGGATDVNGNYRLSVPASATSLTFTYLGYTRKEVAISGSIINVALESSNTALNEVLVVGFGTVRKRDATGAVVKVTSDDFVQGVTTNPLQQLQGKAPGVVVTTFDGDPNSNPIVRIRGTISLTGGNDPLYVIDGIEGADIRSVSPSDIESYDVLKDASAAAIYGSRAAGGVIIITTKTGKAGKTQLTANAYVASESPLRLLNFADRNQYLALYQQTHGGASMPTGTSTTSDQGANTNWFKQVTRSTITHQENVGLSGGSEKGHYRGSVTYYDQEGIAYNYRKDINARVNLDQKTLNDKLLITMNLSGSHTNSKLVDVPGQASTDGNVFLNAAAVPSVISPYNAPGTAYDPQNPNNYQLINNTQEANPLPLLFYTQNTGLVDRISGRVRLDYTLTKDITLSPYYDATRSNGFTQIYYPPSLLVKPINDQFGYAPTLTNHGDIDQGYNISTNKTYGGYATYKGVYGAQRLNVTLGAETFEQRNMGTRIGAHDFNDINAPGLNIGSANSISTKDISSYNNGYILHSIFGRVEYNYHDKYYFTGNARYDYSNKLGLNNQSQVFPSGSVAWAVSNEDFMKDVRWISNLKLRGGYGQVGDQESISAYASQFLFGPNGKLFYNGATGTFQSAPFSIQNQNTNLKWETIGTTNVAVDFGLFNNRLTGSLDVFYKKTKDLLFNYTVPVGGQYFVNNILANIGSLENRGFEFNLVGKIVDQKGFHWTATANFGLVRNKITNLSGSLNNTNFNVTQSYTGGGTSGLGISGAISQIGYLKVGMPVGTLLLPEYAGQSTTAITTNGNSFPAGSQLFWKYAADGSRTATPDVSQLNYADDGSTQDRKFYTTDPKFTYSFNNSFSFGQFDANIFVRGQYGSKAFNETYMDYTSLTKVGTYGILADATKYNITSSSQPSTFWLQSTSFLKIQSANVGYNFNIKSNNYIDKIHVYVAGNNLYTFTSYKGLDPEITTAGAFTGIDIRALYPRTRQISFGVNLTLK